MCRIDGKWKIVAVGILLSFSIFWGHTASAIDVKMTPEEYQEYLRLKNAEDKKSLRPTV